MITCYFGLPGCGKSTLLAKLARTEIKRIEKGKSKYRMVLCNYYIEGCYQIDFSMIGSVDMSQCLILLDEITLDADSRDFKDFAKRTKQFFILHRHYDCDIIYVTQQYDGVDRKIRELTANLFYMRKCGPLTYSTAIYRKITIDQEGDIKMGYELPTLIKIVFDPKNNLRFVWRPRWYRYFDTKTAPPLQKVDFKKYE